MISPRISKWGIAILYIAFIYATLSVVRIPTNYLRSLGLLRFSLSTLYFASLGICFFLLWKTGTREAWRYVLVASVFLSYILIAKGVKQPEEQIHFFQYGLVGIFIVRALNTHSISKYKGLILALVLGGLAGWVDELIQDAIPNRFYDPKDIILNIVSVFMGLILYLAFPKKHA